LHRSSSADVTATFEDPVAATAQVLAGAFYAQPPARFAGRLGFVNLTRQSLLEGVLHSVPPDRVGAEVLEGTIVDAPLIEAVRTLRAKGYRVALDDFRLGDGRNSLLEFADVVKLDVQVLDRVEVERTVAVLRSGNVQLLAEKVETHDEFEVCRDLKFDLFQGYLFSLPFPASTRVPLSQRLVASLIGD
jgi:EAL and modified HD-GYP domain-containing signal transduction protein